MKLVTQLMLLSLCSGFALAFSPPISNAGMQSLQASITPRDEPVLIDEERRSLMNLIVLGTSAISLGALGVPYLSFFVPPGAGGSGSDFVGAKDALGRDLYLTTYLGSHPTGDRSLVQGLKGDPTYLIVKEGDNLESFGLNAICTHLGCVVPWSEANNKFICPCHGSQYDPDGAVVRGPAPLPLALAHCDVDESGMIRLSPWAETDFRTGEKAWWN